MKKKYVVKPVILQKCVYFPNYTLKKDGSCKKIGCERKGTLMCGGKDYPEPNWN